jgi:tagatose-1,6-bisphosphate aldolase non-catalytic subunit AgaZ/GatZ
MIEAAKGNPENLPLAEYILGRIQTLKKETGVNRTIFAACPNSRAVIRAAIRSAKRCNAPIKFAATLNQVDFDSGYTGLTQKEFVKLIHKEADKINYTGPVMIAIDHGGPWLKDAHRLENLPYEKTMELVKKSMIEALEAGYNLLHVDPTVDITLNKDETISIETVADRTVEIITHVENYRRKNSLSKISYEVGTEEVHGGLADMSVFRKFLNLLKNGLSENGLSDVWPCFIVGKVGTDLHTTTFDPDVAKQLTYEAAKFGSVIKGHYSDNVSNPKDYPLAGMGGANIGPEFTEMEYDGLMECVDIEETLFKEDKIAKRSGFKAVLWKAVIDSNRWKKWLLPEEEGKDFDSIAYERQLWLIKTGCRYIWEKPSVVAARARLFENLEDNGVEAETIVLTPIEKSMDKYFYSFNLIDLNNEL